MKPENKIIQHRLSVLQLAEALGNITQACKQRGVSRTQFYEYNRRFQTHGMEGLRDLPPIAKNNPFTTPKEVVAKNKALAMKHPSQGFNYLEAKIKAEGHKVSFVTIQKILEKEGLGSRYDRWLALEKEQAGHPIGLSGEKVTFLENETRSFRNAMWKDQNEGSCSVRTPSLSAL